jgi:UDP-glucose 4-epimerase
VVLELMEQGAEVIVLNDLSTGNRDRLPDEVRHLIGHIGDTDFTT